MNAAAAFLIFMLSSLPVGAQALLKPGSTVAFLGLTFLDTSTEGAYFGARDDEAARLLLIEDEIEARFKAEGFDLLDLAPIQEELDNTVNPSNCYGCEVRMAAKIDADYVLVGVVQKVSNLILAMNLVMRDVGTGDIVRGRVVDIRSNTDESWLRGMRYILKNTFFRK